MSKFSKSLFSFVFVMLFVFTGAVGASAHSVSEYGGFVEYQVDASINFEDIIQVTLTDQDSGETQVHELYRINDYAANFAVPFGVYTVTTEVISANSGEVVTGMVARCITDEIIVASEKIAVPIVIAVDWVDGDVSGTQYHEDGSEVVLDESYGDIEIAESTPEDIVDVDDTQVDEDGSSGWWSILGSLVFSIAVIGIGALVVMYLKNRN